MGKVNKILFYSLMLVVVFVVPVYADIVNVRDYVTGGLGTDASPFTGWDSINWANDKAYQFTGHTYGTINGITISNSRSITLKGVAPGVPGQTNGTKILATAAMANLIFLNRDNQITIRDMVLDGNLFVTNVLKIDNGSAALNYFENLFLTSPAEGGTTCRMVPTIAGDQLSEMVFTNVTFQVLESTTTCVNFRLDSSNSLNIRMFGCNFWGRADRHIIISAGSLWLYQVNFENSRNYDIQKDVNGYFAIFGGYSETGINGQPGGTDSILTTAGSNPENPIVIVNYVHTGVGTNGTGTTLTHTNNGQRITLINVSGGILTNNSTKGMIVIGGDFPGGFQGFQQASILQLGDLGQAGRSVTSLVNPNISGLTGLSVSGIEAKNVRGSIIISGTVNSGTVTFATAEPDASYYITVTPTVITGTPANGSNHIKSISKTATGFTITLDAAPGNGNSRAFDWHLIR